MDCQTARNHLGEFVDGELSQRLREKLATHLEGCGVCGDEVQALGRLAARLAEPVEAGPPSDLWDIIAQRLDDAQNPAALKQRRLVLGRPLALAASVALLIGVGIIAVLLLGPSTTAEAATIDFTLFLDGLHTDVSAAVDKFLAHYGAQPMAAADAHAFAPGLNFAVPDELPGGFQLQDTYKLYFKDKPGIATRYVRGDEPLVTLVHPPIDRQNFGTHEDAPCIVGETHAHQVEVGPWRLIHLKERTTCHCVLSKLDHATEMPAVISHIAPNFTPVARPHGQ